MTPFSKADHYKKGPILTIPKMTLECRMSEKRVDFDPKMSQNDLFSLMRHSSVILGGQKTPWGSPNPTLTKGRVTFVTYVELCSTLKSQGAAAPAAALARG